MSVRKALESLYKGRCNIYHCEDYEEGNLTKQKRTLLYKDIACRLSFGKSASASPAVASGIVPGVVQTVTLFIAPDIDIPAGCEIEVTQNGRTEIYDKSGQSKLYTTHQEISLKIKEEFR